MKRYDAMQPPDVEEWLSLDELERMRLVSAHHKMIRDPAPNPRLHATIHVVVENQLAERIPAVEKTLSRLMAEGLDRHDAIHAIGSVVAEQVWDILRENHRGRDPNEEYNRRLQSLTAASWRQNAG